MNQIIKTTLGLLSFRSGPQDMPYSQSITRALALAAIVASSLLLLNVATLPVAVASSVAMVIAQIFFTRALLRANHLDARLEQTLAAQFAVVTAFSLLLYPTFKIMGPFALAAMKNPQTIADMQAGKTQLPAAMATASFFGDIIFIWSAAVAARINREAANLSAPASWLVTLLSLVLIFIYVTFTQILVTSLSR